ncbi:hypothetical protein HGA88_01495 [Candidatus Roizmanbacteria bacterium]|nr:hypothetical protein [Candidatus Roizmanbacteria bacterium]
MYLSIPIPKDGELAITVGQTVDYGTPFVKQKDKKEIKVPLASLLHKPEKKIFQYLKKFVGEQIEKDELIAEAKSFLGTKKYKSPVRGVLKEINHTDGSITIETDSENVSDLVCYFCGEVAEVGDEDVKIKVKHLKEITIAEPTNSFGGEILWYNGDEPYNLKFDITDQKIVFSVSLTPFEQVKLETLGVDGYVTIHELPEPTQLPKAKFHQLEDWQKLKEHNFPYCIVDGKNNKMYLYGV